MKNFELKLLSLSHIVDDMYQGAVPALLPFMVLERDYSYAQTSGLILAATVLSSVAQPAFGVLTDRRRLFEMVAAGLTLAGIGVGLTGLTDDYLLTWLALALSGLGVAAYHPEAARSARLAAAGRHSAMGWFALGGNIGFALGPLLVTPVILLFGLRGTPLLTLPALLMGALLLFYRARFYSQSPAPSLAGSKEQRLKERERDDWPSFVRLTGLVICRSILFFGLSSFLALYITRSLGAGEEIGELALVILLVCGAAGTVLGGWLADRYSRLRIIRLGYLASVPVLLGLVWSGQPWLFGFIALTGLCLYIPLSLQVTLAQDYLPSRIGTASGVTLGLAVSAGGLFAPLLGLLADAAGLQTALTVLAALPLLALLLAISLREPQLASTSNKP